MIKHIVALLITLASIVMIHNSAVAITGCEIQDHYQEYENGDGRYDYPCDEGDEGWPCIYTPIDGCPEGCIYRVCFTATEFACEWQTLEYVDDQHPPVPCQTSVMLAKDCWNLSDDGRAFVCLHDDPACWRCINKIAGENYWTNEWLTTGYMHEEHKEKCDC